MKQSSSQASRSCLLALAMFIIPVNVLMIAPVLYYLSLPTKTDWHMRHQKSYSRCQALYFMPWAEQMCKQHLGLKIVQPQKTIWTEETSNKWLLCDHRWPLGHVVLKIVKRQKTIPVLSTHNLIIWFVLAQSILQIQSSSWFTCAHFLAGGLWWFGSNGFRLHGSSWVMCPKSDA